MNENPPEYPTNHLCNTQWEYLHNSLPSHVELQRGMRYRLLSRQPVNLQSSSANLSFASDETFLAIKDEHALITKSVPGTTYDEYVSLIGQPSHLLSVPIGFNQIQIYSGEVAAGTSPKDFIFTSLFTPISKLKSLIIDEIIIKAKLTKDVGANFNEGFSQIVFTDISAVSMFTITNQVPSHETITGEIAKVFYWKANTDKQALLIPNGTALLYFANVGGAFTNIYYSFKLRIH